MKKFIIWLILWAWTLFFAWQIFISHDSLIDVFFKAIYYWLNLLVIIICAYLIHILIAIFWEKQYFWNENKSIFNLKSIWIFIFWILIMWILLDYIQSEERKAIFYSLAENISNHIKIEEWKMPVFYIWGTWNIEETDTWVYFSNPKN